jgi:CheY-specific phosphatase CheX
MAMDVDTTSLEAVAPEIWDMMLSLELDPLAAAPAELFPPGQSTITALVTVNGDWSGAIAVQTSTEAGARFAAAMFLADDPTVMSIDEIRDAAAELTNMTGGNIKNLLPVATRLGIPAVTEGTGYTVTVPRTVPIHKLVYDCNGDTVLVTVFEAV